MDSRSRSLAIAITTICLVLSSGTLRPNPNPELADLTAEEIETRANFAVAGGRFEEAIPYIRHILDGVAKIRDPAVVRAIAARVERLEFVYGFCLVAANRLDEAQAALNEFLEKYPQSSSARMALTLVAYCQRQEEDWRQAVETLRKVLSYRDIPLGERYELTLNLGESLFGAGEFEAAVVPLEFVAFQAQDPSVRMIGFSLLVQSMLSAGKTAEIDRLIPQLQGSTSPARYSFDFNLKVIEAADQLINKEEFGLAFVLLKLAASGEALKKGLQDVKRSLENQQQRLRSLPGGVLANFQQIVAVDTRLAIVNNEIDAVENAVEYDQALVFRMGTALMGMNLSAEAYWAFDEFFRLFPDAESADSALYAQGILAGRIGWTDRAIEKGREFISKFVASEDAPSALLNLAYMLQEETRFKEMAEVLTQGIDAGILTRQPTDEAHGLFLLGYAQLYEGSIPEGLATLTTLRDKFPDSEFAADADFWIGFANLSLGDYDDAEAQFQRILSEHPNSSYAIDALYRLALVSFGRGDYAETEARVRAFLDSPASGEIRGDAYNLLGDVLAAEGKLDDALEAYALVEGFTANPAVVHDVIFKAAKVMRADQRWEEIDRHFSDYLIRHGDDARYTMAVLQRGEALQNLGRENEALESYVAAFNRFADDRENMAADQLMQEFVSGHQRVYGRPAVSRITELLREAKPEQTTRGLRLLWALSLASENVELPTDFSEFQINASPPAVLIWIGEILASRGKLDTAEKAFSEVLEFPKSEWTIAALMALGEISVSQNKPDQAVEYFARVREQFPSNLQSGRATMAIADIYAAQGKLDEALELYESVPLTREWRGPLWPEALYKIGHVKQRANQFEEAFAYFQRVYVMYQNNVEWAARSYLASGECLERLGKANEAVATYEELLGLNPHSETESAAVARERLLSLRKSLTPNPSSES